MLLNRKVFEIVKAASDDETRYALTGLYIDENGSSVACDGHVLFKFTPTAPADPKEYPVVEGISTNGKETLKPFLLSPSAAYAILATVPKKRAGLMPILRNIVLDTKATNENKYALLAFTDLKRPTLFRPEKMDTEYVDYEKVIPKGKPSMTIGLNVDILKKALSVLSALDVEMINVKLFDPLKALVITATTKENDGQVLGVIMPMSAAKEETNGQGEIESKAAAAETEEKSAEAKPDSISTKKKPKDKKKVFKK